MSLDPTCVDCLTGLLSTSCLTDGAFNSTHWSGRDVSFHTFRPPSLVSKVWACSIPMTREIKHLEKKISLFCVGCMLFGRKASPTPPHTMTPLIGCYTQFNTAVYVLIPERNLTVLLFPGHSQPVWFSVHSSSILFLGHSSLVSLLDKVKRYAPSFYTGSGSKTEDRGWSGILISSSWPETDLCRYCYLSQEAELKGGA